MNTEKRDFDKEAASWDAKPSRIKQANDVFKAIAGLVILNPTMDVLDFGCGTGLVTVQFSPLVHSITGVDSSRKMLEVLQSKIADQHLNNVKTQFLDFDKGGVLEGRYDLIVSSMTFHHVRDIEPLLAQFHKITAPSGTLCVADLDLDDGQFHANKEGVFHSGFDRPALRAAFVEAGFKDVRDGAAAEVMRPNPDGVIRRFTVFLIVGRK